MPIQIPGTSWVLIGTVKPENIKTFKVGRIEIEGIGKIMAFYDTASGRLQLHEGNNKVSIVTDLGYFSIQ